MALQVLAALHSEHQPSCLWQASGCHFLSVSTPMVTGPESADTPGGKQQLERKDSLLTAWPFQSWQPWLSEALRLLYILFYPASQFLPAQVILIENTSSLPQMQIPCKDSFFSPKKCTRWRIFLLNGNVFLLTLNVKDNLTQNKILGSQTPSPKDSVDVAPYSFCI